MFSIPHYDFSGVLADADVLLTVPPFAKLEWACLALHILQACAKREGFTVQVFYANLAMAAWIGEDNYRRICNKGYLGEAIFARYVHKSINQDIKLNDQCIEIRDSLGNWIASLMNGVLKNSYKILGCSTTYEQINPSIAFVNYAKQIQPELITVLGGSNCYRELAPAMLSLSDQIDYIFSGESEISFPNFLKNVLDGKYPKERIIQEEICDINEIPIPDYSDYLRQLEYFLPQSKLFQESEYYLSYETYQTIIDNVSKLAAYCDVSARVTVTNYQIDLIGMYQKLENAGFCAMKTECVVDHKLENSEEEFRYFVHNLQLFADYFIDNIKQRKIIYYTDFLSVLKNFHFGAFPSFFPCSAGLDKYAVTTDGSIYFCHYFSNIPEFKWGDVNHGFDREKRIQFLKSHLVMVRGKENCDNCWAQRICGGTCYYISYVESETTKSISDNYCRFKKEIFKKALYIYTSLLEEEKVFLDNINLPG